MGMRVAVRAVTDDEGREIGMLAASRSGAVRVVQRARVIAAMLDDAAMVAARAARQAGFKNPDAGVQWVRRFNAGGVAALYDRPRTGRPHVHGEDVRGALVALARQKPRGLGYPFALWTEGRLREAFRERTGIRLGLATLWRWVEAEGLRWKRQQTWFVDVEKHDPAFAEKRGLSSQPTASRRRRRG